MVAGTIGRITQNWGKVNQLYATYVSETAKSAILL